MRKWFLLVTVLALLAVGLSACNATTGTGTTNGSVVINNQQEGISVSGQGKVVVTPDLAELTLGVQSQESTVAAAQANATGAMNKVMTALTSNGIAGKDIQTQRYSIDVVSRYDNNTQQSVIVGYMVTNLVIVKIRALDKTGAIIDAVTAAGGDLTRINGVSFTVENPTTYYNQARSLAVTDAKAKAEQLASLGNVSLGKIKYMTESTSFPIVGKGEVAAPSVPGTPISTGEIDITASVQVIYAVK